MHTLADLLGKVLALSSLGTARGAPAALIKPRNRLPVPGQNALVLPADPRGVERIVGQKQIRGLDDSIVPAARLSLVYRPGIAMALPAPENPMLVGLGLEPEKFRNENPRCVGTAIALKEPDGAVVYGISRTIVVENGLRMGSSEIVLLDDQWTDNLEHIEELLLSLYLEATSVRIGPEPGSTPWKTVVALLGGVNKSERLPHDWQRQMRIAAGLRALDLKISPSPESARVSVVQELREKPPDALLVWVNWVRHPDSFIGPYRAARPRAYAEVLGSQDDSTSFEEDVAELILHTREIAPLATQVSSPDLVPVTWETVAEEIAKIVGPHFALTERASRMMRENLYPKPDRMLAQVQALAKLAMAYRAANGQIGMRLADYAIAEFGIDIALFDSSLSFPAVTVGGKTWKADFHVKVDDFKSPDQCGRIYFFIDDGLCFMVDHIGLHDYGK